MKPLISHRGSAILVALVVLILLTITTTVFLERIWTFNQTSKGIEASNVAYYEAEWLIEDQLYGTGVTKYQPWNIETFIATGGTSTGRALYALTGSSVIPRSWEGTSTFDTDFNIITLGSPVQLVIPEGINWNNVFFTFRIPTIWGVFSGINPANTWSGYILWTLGYTWASLFASGETNIFRWIDLGTPTATVFPALNGVSNTGSNITVLTFYNHIDYLGWGAWNGWNCAWYACTLKLSLIRPIPLADGRTIPFLEYKIDLSTASITAGPITLPSQYMNIHSLSYAYGFYRSKTVKIPQITTNTALDFAILQ